MTILKPSSNKKFICYLCEEEKDNKHKGLVVGSGEIFTDHICRLVVEATIVYGEATKNYR